MLERIEIYKGVLPVGLGADALGGGINMATKKSYTNYAEGSYEVASFNTHRASLNLFHQDTNRHYFIGSDVFFNHSDNNYNVDVKVTDPELGIQTQSQARLFHNDFTHYYGEVYGGIVNANWVDELRIGLTAFHINRDNQHGARMIQPYGASTSRQYSVVPTLRFRKSFLNRRLQFDQFLVANKLHVQQVDTLKGIYDWYGKFQSNNSRRGEIAARGSHSDIAFSYFTSRSNVSYELAPDHKLELNVVHTRLSRKGSDPLGLTFITSNRDILSVPAYYNKMVAALGVESQFAEGKIVNNLIGKYYYAETSATDGDFYGNEIVYNTSDQQWGLAEAIKYQINNFSFVRGSVEAATRLPEQDEIFGDGNFHVSNFELKLERSINANLGYRVEKIDRYSIELNTFYRITHDLIQKVPYNLVFTRNENIDNVRGIGFETDATVSILPWLKINGNFTYQDFRLFNTGNSSTEGARRRNTPYFFSNLGLNVLRSAVFNRRDRVEGYWYFTHVRQYYLENIPKEWETGGFMGLFTRAKFTSDLSIPDQNIHTTGLTYYPLDRRLSIGVQCKNVFNKNIYDNFRVQNAGRSFHLKLTYILN
jgi:outer membrane receptor protein involved in Fe transport